MSKNILTINRLIKILGNNYINKLLNLSLQNILTHGNI